MPPSHATNVICSPLEQVSKELSAVAARRQSRVKSLEGASEVDAEDPRFLRCLLEVMLRVLRCSERQEKWIRHRRPRFSRQSFLPDSRTSAGTLSKQGEVPADEHACLRLCRVMSKSSSWFQRQMDRRGPQSAGCGRACHIRAFLVALHPRTWVTGQGSKRRCPKSR